MVRTRLDKVGRSGFVPKILDTACHKQQHPDVPSFAGSLELAIRDRTLKMIGADRDVGKNVGLSFTVMSIP